MQGSRTSPRKTGTSIKKDHLTVPASKKGTKKIKSQSGSKAHALSTLDKTSADNTVLKKTRKPAHCRICEGRPLRIQCEHTKSGAIYLLEKKAHETLMSLPLPSASPNDPPVAQPSPQQYNTSENSTLPILPSKDMQVEVPPDLFVESVPNQEVGLYTLDSPVTPRNVHTLPPFPKSPTSPQIDPALEHFSVRDSTSSPHLNPADSSPQATVSSSGAVSRRAAARERGTIEGVMRGVSEEHIIYRTKGIPEPLTSSKQASKHFLETFNSIIQKCDTLSRKTGCWLFVGAQHPNASRQAIHYASPRLRRDGAQATDELGTSFVDLIRRITVSRQQEAFEMQQELRAAQDREKALTSDVDILSRELETTKEKSDREAKLIQEYIALYGPLPGAK
ncbi:hypothetical protein NLJ89_g6668 [Agrocybe chaxingu]|uniref:Uncharacterized protein n=1 Tax=Agrocybe chaxingu TaxID=84603 RepID=A0A9W8MTV2_9AGAR|nr:hypothetical protein NLJ89_g6668 [Agrocybe chaxingu]